MSSTISHRSRYLDNPLHPAAPQFRRIETLLGQLGLHWKYKALKRGPNGFDMADMEGLQQISNILETTLKKSMRGTRHV